jgi:hypothetical protein
MQVRFFGRSAAPDIRGVLEMVGAAGQVAKLRGDAIDCPPLER